MLEETEVVVEPIQLGEQSVQVVEKEGFQIVVEEEMEEDAKRQKFEDNYGPQEEETSELQHRLTED